MKNPPFPSHSAMGTPWNRRCRPRLFFAGRPAPRSALRSAVFFARVLFNFAVCILASLSSSSAQINDGPPSGPSLGSYGYSPDTSGIVVVSGFDSLRNASLALSGPVVIFSSTFLNLTSAQLASNATLAASLERDLEAAVLASLPLLPSSSLSPPLVAVGSPLLPCAGGPGPTLSAAVALNGSLAAALALVHSALLGGSLASPAAEAFFAAYGEARIDRVQVLSEPPGESADGAGLPSPAPALLPASRPAVVEVDISSAPPGGSLAALASLGGPGYSVSFTLVLGRVNADMAQLADPGFAGTLEAELSAALYRAAGPGALVAFERTTLEDGNATAACSRGAGGGLALNASVVILGQSDVFSRALAFVTVLQKLVRLLPLAMPERPLPLMLRNLTYPSFLILFPRPLSPLRMAREVFSARALISPHSALSVSCMSAYPPIPRHLRPRVTRPYWATLRPRQRMSPLPQSPHWPPRRRWFSSPSSSTALSPPAAQLLLACSSRLLRKA